VYYRLRNQKDPNYSLILTRSAWHRFLEMARQAGWNPMGTVHPDLMVGLSSIYEEIYSVGDHDNGTYTPKDSRQVMLDDALNLGDALDRAFLTFEPQAVSAYASFYRKEEDRIREWSRPGIGTLLELVDFCRSGSFFIENQVR
jgi:hypothetical protein